MAKKEYEVVGDSIVHGAKKGEKFLADLLEHEEALLIAGGHVKVASASATATAGGEGSARLVTPTASDKPQA